VVGTTGSGKTTLSQDISKRLQIPHIELDALYWETNWTGVPEPVFRERVKGALVAEQWVIDGNYSRVRNLIWGRADTVVYLDYSFGRIFWQLFKRTIKRSVQKEALWNGNYEDLRKSFFSKDSIMVWMIRTYRRRQKQYAKLFEQPEYAHLQIVQLKTPQLTKAWLTGLESVLE